MAEETATSIAGLKKQKPRPIKDIVYIYDFFKPQPYWRNYNSNRLAHWIVPDFQYIELTIYRFICLLLFFLIS